MSENLMYNLDIYIILRGIGEFKWSEIEKSYIWPACFYIKINYNDVDLILKYRDVNGIMQPKTLKQYGICRGDLIYFDGYDTVIEYNVTD